MIENVIIKNFKSIRDLELPLTNLNVLIGSNGVGKSNFISFFEMAKASSSVRELPWADKLHKSEKTNALDAALKE
jgi:predicted ATPase